MRKPAIDQIISSKFYALNRGTAHFPNIWVLQIGAGQIITPNDLVDLNLTSRSSTYRKLADLRELNLIKEDWIDGQCQLSAADGTKEFINSLQNGIQFITAQ
jgi:hypothetical protein